MCLLGRRGMLRVKWTLERPQLSSFNGQPNTPASILLGWLNKKHDIKRFKKLKTLNLLISCFLFIRPSKMLAGVLRWPLKTKLFPKRLFIPRTLRRLVHASLSNPKHSIRHIGSGRCTSRNRSLIWSAGSLCPPDVLTAGPWDSPRQNPGENTVYYYALLNLCTKRLASDHCIHNPPFNWLRLLLL